VACGPQKYLSGVFCFYYVTSVVLTTGFADMVRPFLFTTVGAFLRGGGRQGIMGSAHVTLGF
jgi:hypothetical protein